MPPKPKKAKETEPVLRDVVLHVTPLFELPSLYTTAPPEVVEEALRIGAHLYETVRQASTSMTVTDLEAAKAAELARFRADAAAVAKALEARIVELEVEKAADLQRIRADAAESTRELEAHLEKARQDSLVLQREKQQQRSELLELQATAVTTARREEKEATQRQLEARMKAIQVELETIQEKNAALLERKAIVEAGRDADIRTAEERTRALLQQTIDEKQKGIERAERLLAAQQDSFTRQAEELRALSDLLRKKPSANAKVKGNEYEEIFRERLVAAFGLCDGFRLDAKGNNGFGHEADFLMEVSKRTVLWEVKNYDKPVGSAEVDKFHRDMKENPQARIGVMVSRYTSIVGKTATGDRFIEFIDGQMLVYLSRFEAMSDDVLPNLLLLFRLWWDSERSVEDTESKEETIRQIEKLLQAAVKAKVEWRLHKNRLDEATRWMAEQVEEHEARLKQALHVLRGATLVDVPEGIFRDVAGDEKAQQLVQLILEYAVPHPTGSVVINDLAEYVGVKKGLSRDTARTHIRAVLLDAAYEQPKGKPGRVLGLVPVGGGATVAVGVAVGVAVAGNTIHLDS